MDANHDAGLPKSEPGSHRRDGKAQVAMRPHSFRGEPAEYPRGALLVAVAGLLAGVLGWLNLVERRARLAARARSHRCSRGGAHLDLLLLSFPTRPDRGRT